MSEDMKQLWLLVFVYILGAFTHWGVTQKDLNAISDAVEQCEETLPRNQHCDWKVETFVVEEE